MSNKPLNRRAVLRGLLTTGGCAAVGLPLLEAMLDNSGSALAQDGTPVSPLFVSWFFGNGTLPGLWNPSGVGIGANWELSPQLQALSDVKSHLTVLSGLEGKLVVGGVEHPSGSAAATTGCPLNGNAVQGASIDQIVADHISEGAAFRSLELGVTPATPNGPQDSLHTVSHNGPSSRNNPEFEPAAVFSRLFGGFEPPTEPDQESEGSKLAKVRKSVLDSVKSDGLRLQERLGTADRQRIEAHLESIRSIERRLQSVPTEAQASACTGLMSPSVGPDARSEAPPEVNTAMADLTTLALACERTRVVSFMFSLPAAHVYYRHLAADMNDDFHDTICHGDPGDAANQPRVDTGVQYAMRCLNELLLKLQNTPHGASTLLDSTLVYVTSDTAWGKIHERTEWPVLLAGKAGGRLAGDGHFRYPGENLSRALLTVAQVMGIERAEFGKGDGHVADALTDVFV